MDKTINKEPYLAPQAVVLDIQTEGVVCASAPGYENGGPLFG